MQRPASPPSAARRYGAPSRTGNVTGFAIVFVLHAAALMLLLQYAPAREALASAVPLMVNLITPPQTKPTAPDTLPKPLPMKRLPQPRVTPPQPLLATNADTPSPVSVPLQPVDTAPLQPPVAAAPELAPVAAAPPVVPPSFNADYLNNPAPEYPAISRRLGEQGRVVFRVYVEANGLPSDVRVQTSSGFERLDNVALAAIKRWKFVPARRGDAAVGGWVLVPLSFSLRS